MGEVAVKKAEEHLRGLQQLMESPTFQQLGAPLKEPEAKKISPASKVSNAEAQIKGLIGHAEASVKPTLIQAALNQVDAGLSVLHAIEESEELSRIISSNAVELFRDRLEETRTRLKHGGVEAVEDAVLFAGLLKGCVEVGVAREKAGEMRLESRRVEGDNAQAIVRDLTGLVETTANDYQDKAMRFLMNQNLKELDGLNDSALSLSASLVKADVYLTKSIEFETTCSEASMGLSEEMGKYIDVLARMKAHAPGGDQASAAEERYAYVNNFFDFLMRTYDELEAARKEYNPEKFFDEKGKFDEKSKTLAPLKVAVSLLESRQGILAGFEEKAWHELFQGEEGSRLGEMVARAKTGAVKTLEGVDKILVPYVSEEGKFIGMVSLFEFVEKQKLVFTFGRKAGEQIKEKFQSLLDEIDAAQKDFLQGHESEARGHLEKARELDFEAQELFRKATAKYRRVYEEEEKYRGMEAGEKALYLFQKYGTYACDGMVIGAGIAAEVASGGSASPLVLGLETSYWSLRAGKDVYEDYLARGELSWKTIGESALLVIPTGGRFAKAYFKLAEASKAGALAVDITSGVAGVGLMGLGGYGIYTVSKEGLELGFGTEDITNLLAGGVPLALGLGRGVVPALESWKKKKKRAIEAPKKEIAEMAPQLEKGLFRPERFEEQRKAFLEKPFSEERAVEVLVQQAKTGEYSSEYMLTLAGLRTLSPEIVARVKESASRMVSEKLGEKKVAGFEKHFDWSMRLKGVYAPDYKPVYELDVKFPSMSEQGKGMQNPLLEKVFEIGKREEIQAQGVDPKKGGMQNFLNIMLEGEVRQGGYGLLAGGDPFMMAGPHGPYYVVVDVAKGKVRGEQPTFSQSAHIAYLVPTEADKVFVKTALGKAVEKGRISKTEMDYSLARVVTYDEFVKARPGAFQSVEAFNEFKGVKSPTVSAKIERGEAPKEDMAKVPGEKVVAEVKPKAMSVAEMEVKAAKRLKGIKAFEEFFVGGELSVNGQRFVQGMVKRLGSWEKVEALLDYLKGREAGTENVQAWRKEFAADREKYLEKARRVNEGLSELERLPYGLKTPHAFARMPVSEAGIGLARAALEGSTSEVFTGSTLKEGISIARESGLTGIEITVDRTPFNKNTKLPSQFSAGERAEIRQMTEGLEVTVHSPILLKEVRPGEFRWYDVIRDTPEYIETIEFARDIGAKSVVIHVTTPGAEFVEALFKKIDGKSVVDVAAESGVKIAIENSFKLLEPEKTYADPWKMLGAKKTYHAVEEHLGTFELALKKILGDSELSRDPEKLKAYVDAIGITKDFAHEALARTQEAVSKGIADPARLRQIARAEVDEFFVKLDALGKKYGLDAKDIIKEAHVCQTDGFADGHPPASAKKWKGFDGVERETVLDMEYIMGKLEERGFDRKRIVFEQAKQEGVVFSPEDAFPLARVEELKMRLEADITPNALQQLSRFSEATQKRVLWEFENSRASGKYKGTLEGFVSGAREVSGKLGKSELYEGLNSDELVQVSSMLVGEMGDAGKARDLARLLIEEITPEQYARSTKLGEPFSAIDAVTGLGTRWEMMDKVSEGLLEISCARRALSRVSGIIGDASLKAKEASTFTVIVSDLDNTRTWNSMLTTSGGNSIFKEYGIGFIQQFGRDSVARLGSLSEEMLGVVGGPAGEALPKLRGVNKRLGSMPVDAPFQEYFKEKKRPSATLGCVSIEVQPRMTREGVQALVEQTYARGDLYVGILKENGYRSSTFKVVVDGKGYEVLQVITKTGEELVFGFGKEARETAAGGKTFKFDVVKLKKIENAKIAGSDLLIDGKKTEFNSVSVKLEQPSQKAVFESASVIVDEKQLSKFEGYRKRFDEMFRGLAGDGQARVLESASDYFRFFNPKTGEVYFTNAEGLRGYLKEVWGERAGEKATHVSLDVSFENIAGEVGKGVNALMAETGGGHQAGTRVIENLAMQFYETIVEVDKRHPGAGLIDHSKPLVNGLPQLGNIRVATGGWGLQFTVAGDVKPEAVKALVSDFEKNLSASQPNNPVRIRAGIAECVIGGTPFMNLLQQSDNALKVAKTDTRLNAGNRNVDEGIVYYGSAVEGISGKTMVSGRAGEIILENYVKTLAKSILEEGAATEKARKLLSSLGIREGAAWAEVEATIGERVRGYVRENKEMLVEEMGLKRRELDKKLGIEI